ncbi:alkaline phosphatase D family protein [soil metagenome]
MRNHVCVAGTIDRRGFVRGAAGAAVAATLATRGTATEMATAAGKTLVRPVRGGRFRQGVASGQPGPRAMTLWTKLSDVELGGNVTLEVARDPGFDRVVERRQVRAMKLHDFAVKARVTSLRPNERYFYRFETGHKASPVGEFKTLPAPGSRVPIRIGIFSCQDYVPGFYTGHAGLAAEDDLDLVVCLGDYIYERIFYEKVRDDQTGKNGDGEVQTLREYREKYALYHSDENLRELRRRHPFMAIWDDHEVEDNYAADIPGEATQDPRRPFLKRRRSAYRAYFEHMPFAPAGSGERRRNRFRIHRSIRIGKHAELMLLDQRQYRDDQPCGDTIPPTPPCGDDVRNDPSRTLLGAEQKHWLKRRLKRSGATWKLIGNQAMAMALDIPPTNPLNVDQWDGYGAEREEIFGMVGARGIENVSLLTGDIHTFFAGQLTPTGRQGPGQPAPVATEFVAGSMTSLGIPETINGTTGVPLPPAIQAAIADSVILRGNNPHYAYSNTEKRGYGVVEADGRSLRVQFRSPATTTERESSVSTLAQFEVAAGVPSVQVA